MQCASRMWLAIVVFSLFCACVASFGSNCEGETIDTRPVGNSRTSNKPISDFRVAFFGDQDLGTAPLTLLQQIQQWGARVVFHSGDFDYHDDPSAFFAQRDSVFDLGYPYLTTIGNHDLVMWNDGYESGLAERMKDIKNSTDLHCWGQIGVNMACNYGGEEGVIMIMSGVGTCGTGHEAFIDSTFTAFSKASWKLCTWHKLQYLLQTGDHGDEAGYGVYDICRHHGAIVMTAHTHSYSRTVAMSDFATQSIADPEKTDIHISPGRTFAVVSGLGGHRIENFTDDLEANPWWASAVALPNGTDYGALYCTFNVDGQAGLAECFFQDISGKIWDKFNVWNDGNDVTETRHWSECLREKRDVQIQSRSDEMTSHRSESDLIIVSSQESSKVGLTFRNLNLQKSSDISHAYLQLLCASSFIGTMEYEFQLRNPLTGQTSQTMTSSTKITEDLQGELWISPNLSELLQEVVKSSDDTDVNTIEVIMKAHGEERLVYSFASAPHLAPSFFVQIHSHC